jgi:hypothetical protein
MGFAPSFCMPGPQRGEYDDVHRSAFSIAFQWALSIFLPALIVEGWLYEIYRRLLVMTFFVGSTLLQLLARMPNGGFSALAERFAAALSQVA